MLTTNKLSNKHYKDCLTVQLLSVIQIHNYPLLIDDSGPVPRQTAWNFPLWQNDKCLLHARKFRASSNIHKDLHTFFFSKSFSKSEINTNSCPCCSGRRWSARCAPAGPVYAARPTRTSSDRAGRPGCFGRSCGPSPGMLPPRFDP